MLVRNADTVCTKKADVIPAYACIHARWSNRFSDAYRYLLVGGARTIVRRLSDRIRQIQTYRANNSFFLLLRQGSQAFVTYPPMLRMPGDISPQPSHDTMASASA